jgi:chromosome partitioning protein
VGLRPGHPTYGLFDYLNGERGLREVILPTALPWLRVMLVGSVSEHADHAFYQQLVAETNVVHDLLRTARERCHVVIVDTPPGLGPVARRVLEASQHVIVPLQCEPLALQTTTQILRAVREASARNAGLVLDGILLTMLEDGNAVSQRVASYVREQLPAELLFDVAIPRTMASIDAFAAGQPVVLRSPDDPASRAYTRLADLLDGKLR